MEPAMRQASKTTTVTAWNRRVAGGIQDAPPAKRVGWPLLWIAAQAPTAAMIHPATPISIREAECRNSVLSTAVLWHGKDADEGQELTEVAEAPTGIDDRPAARAHIRP